MGTCIKTEDGGVKIKFNTFEQSIKPKHYKICPLLDKNCYENHCAIWDESMDACILMNLYKLRKII